MRLAAKPAERGNERSVARHTSVSVARASCDDLSPAECWLGLSREKIEGVAEMDTTLAPELKAGR